MNGFVGNYPAANPAGLVHDAYGNGQYRTYPENE